MTRSQPVAEGDGESPAPAQPVSPLINPSYPQRVHTAERAHWQGVLRACEERVSAARQSLDAEGGDPARRQTLDRLHAQMLGARDQIADAARRLPGETGVLYEEDRHRLEEAVAALDRVFRAWDARG